jgi:uncharacterized membrane protein
MEAKVKFAGHPVHPMLIVFPLGLLATSLAFDIAYLASRNTTFATVSYWMIASGIVGGLLAAAFGLVDWLGIPANTRAKNVGFWHGLGNVVVVVLFAVSWWTRLSTPSNAPTAAAFTLSCVAVVLALVTSWLGGELVDRLSVGVDDGAHLNAPSSLSDRPATEGKSTDRPPISRAA